MSKFNDLYNLLMEEVEESLQELLKSNNKMKIDSFINYNILTKDQKDKIIDFCITKYKDNEEAFYMQILQQFLTGEGLIGKNKADLEQKQKIVKSLIQMYNNSNNLIQDTLWESFLSFDNNHSEDGKKLNKEIATLFLNKLIEIGRYFRICHLISLDSNKSPNQILTEEQRKKAIKCLIDNNCKDLLQKLISDNALFDLQLKQVQQKINNEK